MDKLFSVGVANAKIYKDPQKTQLIAVAEGLLDSSIATATSSTEIRGGKRNPLLFTYYHSPNVSLTLNNTHWNLALINANTGGELTKGANLEYTETVTLTGKAGTVDKTPVGSEGGSKIGWIECNGSYFSTTFTGSNFNAPAQVPDNATVRISYTAFNSGADKLTIPTNFIPKTLYIEMENDLATSKAGDGVIGRNVFIMPSAQLSGASEIAMTSDGYTETELTMNGLKYKSEDGKDIFCWMIQEIFGKTWYDNVVDLAVSGSADGTLKVGKTAQLTVWAVEEGGFQSFLVPDYSDLTFSSSNVAKITVSDKGVITGVAEGKATITAKITEKDIIKDTTEITVVA